MTKRLITGIVIHYSATPNGRWTTTAGIDNSHRERGFSRTLDFHKIFNQSLTSIGYCFVVYTNGEVTTGRHLDEVGAYEKIFNANSPGVCLVGTDRFSVIQRDSLGDNLAGLLKIYPNASIRGHRDLSGMHKTCPGFDVSAWLNNDKKPLPEHILETEKL
ncbi:MAG TPA: N-acetylmuramoyl-L-alanine amidase [Nitrosomonas sp.]|nr:N-acetylmuramoyl-L-alanine amidase [Nitrosomonas sp.]HQX14681.1 N-acetylmuramoyl-L-alanine amidase [Nitrosomonas sp.]HRB33783.1 N-acetylmuramoyl-L-alanine amidase [Nitrosomonas sp.]HRB78403.1 N-acetylmuramoyl-L-alanine amidase [Nitrosomonas sp.]